MTPCCTSNTVIKIAITISLIHSDKKYPSESSLLDKLINHENAIETIKHIINTTIPTHKFTKLNYNHLQSKHEIGFLWQHLFVKMIAPIHTFS